MLKNKFILTLFFLLMIIGLASAHVRYVLDKQEMQDVFEAKMFLDPLIIGIFSLVVIILLIATYLFYKNNIQIKLISKLESLAAYSPLILRLFVGTALISAGMSGWLLSPDLPMPSISLIEIAIGILLVFGLLTRIAAAGLLALWALSLLTFGLGITDSGAMHHFEIAGIALFLIISGASKYSLDERIKLNIGETFSKFQKYQMLVLRLATGITLIWLSIVEKIFFPGLGIAVVEKYALPTLGFPAGTFILIAGLVEFLAGLAILLGLATRLITLVTASFLIIGVLTFGENVSSHFGLFGVTLVLLINGASDISLDYLLKKFSKNKTN